MNMNGSDIDQIDAKCQRFFTLFKALGAARSIRKHNRRQIICRFCFAGSPQLSEAVETAKILLGLWRKEVPKIPDIFILFH